MSLLTLISLGIITAIAIAATIFLYQIGDQFDTKYISNARIICLCVSIFSAILLIFGFYASCCGKTCSNIVMGIIYLIFGLAVLAISVIVWTWHDDIIDAAKVIWTDEQYADVRADLQEWLKCEGWDDCKSVLQSYVKKGLNIGCGTLIGVTILMIIGAGIAFGYACCGKREQYSTLNDAIQYGP